MIVKMIKMDFLRTLVEKVHYNHFYYPTKVNNELENDSRCDIFYK